MKDSEKTRLQLSISPKLREWLEEQAELRGQPLASVATHMLVDTMIDYRRHETISSEKHEKTD